MSKRFNKVKIIELNKLNPQQWAELQTFLFSENCKWGMSGKKAIGWGQINRKYSVLKINEVDHMWLVAVGTTPDPDYDLIGAEALINEIYTKKGLKHESIQPCINPHLPTATKSTPKPHMPKPSRESMAIAVETKMIVVTLQSHAFELTVEQAINLQSDLASLNL